MSLIDDQEKISLIVQFVDIMLLTLIRTNFSPQETTGILLIGGKPFCGTLEPPSSMHCIGTECSANIKTMQASSSSQNKQVVSGALKGIGTEHQKGCIPLGWYKLTLTLSPRFGRVLPLLHYVPGFEGIRIHAGNNRDHTAGCILVGQLSGTTLLHSRSTEHDLVERLQKHRDEPNYIEITTPERFFTEHCSSITDLECLLYGARYDHDKPLADL